MHSIPRTVRLLAWGVVGVRVGVAAAFAVAPSATMGSLFGTTRLTARSRGIAAHYVARDAALGFGLAHGLRNQDWSSAAAWMLAGTAADAVDLAAIAVTDGTKSNLRQRMLLGQMACIVSIDLWLTRRIWRGR